MIVQLILGYIMAQTSIHFQPVRGGSEAHNKREKELDYVHKELVKKVKYIALAEGTSIKEKVTEGLTAIVEQWEASNGEIPIR